MDKKGRRELQTWHPACWIDMEEGKPREGRSLGAARPIEDAENRGKYSLMRPHTATVRG